MIVWSQSKETEEQDKHLLITQWHVLATGRTEVENITQVYVL